MGSVFVCSFPVVRMDEKGGEERGRGGRKETWERGKREREQRGRRDSGNLICPTDHLMVLFGG